MMKIVGLKFGLAASLLRCLTFEITGLWLLIRCEGLNIFCVILIYHITVPSPEPKIHTWPHFMKDGGTSQHICAPSRHFV